MKPLLHVNWLATVAVLGSLGVMLMMLLLIAYVQLWRYRIHRAVRAGAPLRVMRDLRSEVQHERDIQEYLADANFSNEGNPNFGWKEQFLERSFN